MSDGPRGSRTARSCSEPVACQTTVGCGGAINMFIIIDYNGFVQDDPFVTMCEVQVVRIRFKRGKTRGSRFS
jgi:hypothetical protein